MVNPTNSNVVETFTAFFEEWLAEQQAFLEKLLALSVSIDGINKDEECRDLAAQVFAHYQKFYDEKTKAANQDAFLMFSPPWLSSFERTLLWVSGFKPSMVLSLVKNSAGELSDEQMEKLEKLKAETRWKDREIGQAMAEIQESVAERPMVDLMRRMERLVDGESLKLDEFMDEVKESMLMLMENADALRGSTVSKVVEILNPLQTIKFLAAAAQFQLQTRRWGLQRDSQGGTTSATTFA